MTPPPGAGSACGWRIAESGRIAYFSRVTWKGSPLAPSPPVTPVEPPRTTPIAGRLPLVVSQSLHLPKNAGVLLVARAVDPLLDREEAVEAYPVGLDVSVAIHDPA